VGSLLTDFGLFFLDLDWFHLYFVPIWTLFEGITSMLTFSITWCVPDPVPVCYFVGISGVRWFVKKGISGASVLSIQMKWVAFPIFV
jgi:hypothetical protein